MNQKKWNETLSKAANTGDLLLLRQALVNGADINTKEGDGKTPLMKLVDDGNSDRQKKRLPCIKELIAHGADINLTTDDGHSALTFAALKGNEDAIDILIQEKAALNQKSDRGNTAISICLSGSHKKQIADKLIKAGADITASPQNLSLAARQGYTDYVKMCLDSGMDVNKNMPIISAAMEGHINCLELLINAGADVNITSEDGTPALFYAISNGHTECVKRLIAAGAETQTVIEKDHQNIWHIAASSSSPRIAEILKMGFLDDIDFDQQNAAGKTALFLAVENRNAPIVEHLLALGANPDIKDKQGKTALSMQHWNEDEAIIKKLIAKGADTSDMPDTQKEKYAKDILQYQKMIKQQQKQAAYQRFRNYTKRKR